MGLGVSPRLRDGVAGQGRDGTHCCEQCLGVLCSQVLRKQAAEDGVPLLGSHDPYRLNRK